VPSAPPKTAAWVAAVAEVWLQASLAPALFQFVPVVLQVPEAAVMVEPSPDVVSQVKVAALAGVELAARNKADAASADSDDANWGFIRVFVGLVF